MNLLELSTKRYSLRNFEKKPVEKNKIEYILEAARLAPSAVNYQPWYFVVITENESIQKIQACYERDWFKTAPMYILICGDHAQSWKRKDGKDFCDVDIAIAVEHICLAAVEQGLGTCWVCNFDAEKCRQLFELPDNIEPIAILPVGYEKEPLEEFVPKNRKCLEEIVRWEKF